MDKKKRGNLAKIIADVSPAVTLGSWVAFFIFLVSGHRILALVSLLATIVSLLITIGALTNACLWGLLPECRK